MYIIGMLIQSFGVVCTILQTLSSEYQLPPYLSPEYVPEEDEYALANSGF